MISVFFLYTYFRVHSIPLVVLVRNAMANPPAENTVIPFSKEETTLPLLLTLIPALRLQPSSLEDSK